MLLAGINRRLGLAGFGVFVSRRFVQKETVFVQYVYIYVSCCNCIRNRTAILCVLFIDNKALMYLSPAWTHNSPECASLNAVFNQQLMADALYYTIALTIHRNPTTQRMGT